MNKSKLLNILIILISLDIILTFISVTFYGATEINPLCYNFIHFMVIKIIVSIIGLYILSKFKTTPYWSFYILIYLYGIALIFNLQDII